MRNSIIGKNSNSCRTVATATLSAFVIGLCLATGPVQGAGLFEDVGKAIDKGVKSTGKAIGDVLDDTGKAIDKGVKATGKAIDSGAKAVGDTAGKVVDGTVDVLSDTGEFLSREGGKSARFVSREMKVGYCRVTEGTAPGGGNDQNSNGVNDAFERCMADKGNFRRAALTNQNQSEEEALEAEQAYLDDFNAAVQLRFAADVSIDPAIFTNPERFQLVPQGSRTAKILNQPRGIEPFTASSGEGFASRDAYLKRLANDQIAYLADMVDAVTLMDFGNARLQLAEANLPSDAAGDLVLAMTKGTAENANQTRLYAVGTVENVIGFQDVALYIQQARTGQVPIDGLAASFSTLSVIEADSNDPAAEKKQVTKRLQQEMDLLALLLEELG